MQRKLMFLLFLIPLLSYAQSNDPMVLVFEYEPGIFGRNNPISFQFGGTVNVTIDWGGGEIENADTAGTYTHSFSLDNGDIVDTVKISGTLTHFNCDTLQNNYNLVELVSWGNLGLTDLSMAFYRCTKLIAVPDSIPKGVTNLRGMFYFTINFNSDISNWDVSNITDMSYMFYYDQKFNADISSWNVSNVTNMSNMFYDAYRFQGDLSNWNVFNVTNMRGMFAFSSGIISNISNWNVSKVKNMSGMFINCNLSQCDLSKWDISNLTNMSYMFAYTHSYNIDIGNWDISNVTDMNGLFFYSGDFEVDLSNWDVSNLTEMRAMFYGANNFSVGLGSWDVSKVTRMDSMFYYARNFDEDFSSWDVSNVKSMKSMFYLAEDFNSDISTWDVSNVTNMSGMFSQAASFNADISTWNVSNVTDMFGMFYQATSFNTDISTWDVSSVTNMAAMFNNADSFDQNISKWNVSSVTDMSKMFYTNDSFDQDISNWDVSSVTDMSGMFDRASLSTKNYSNMLIEWSKLPLQNNVNFDAGNSKFNIFAAESRQKIIDTYGWIIEDRGLEEMLFSQFSAELKDSTIALSWEVSSDRIDSVFVLERRYIVSEDTTNWENMYTVASETLLNFSYVDSLLPSGDEVHYRILGIDKNENQEISETLVVDISSFTGIEDLGDIPTEFKLSQNYPNPFNPTTTINYSVPEQSHITLKIFDALGKEVTSLVNELKAIGNYSVEFNAANLTSGVYFYQIKADHYIQTKKMILLR